MIVSTDRRVAETINRKCVKVVRRKLRNVVVCFSWHSVVARSADSSRYRVPGRRPCDDVIGRDVIGGSDVVGRQRVGVAADAQRVAAAAPVQRVGHDDVVACVVVVVVVEAVGSRPRRRPAAASPRGTSGGFDFRLWRLLRRPGCFRRRRHGGADGGRRAVAAGGESRSSALRNDTAAGRRRRRRIRSSVFFRRPDTVRRRSATTRTTADRAPRVRRPAAAGRLAPGSPTPAGTSGRLRDVSSGSLAGSDVRGAGSPAMSAERRRQLEVVVGDREEWRMEFGRAETFDVSR